MYMAYLGKIEKCAQNITFEFIGIFFGDLIFRIPQGIEYTCRDVFAAALVERILHSIPLVRAPFQEYGPFTCISYLPS
jgi:hypothetical protein